MKQENLILRDHLAIDRTLLANERTLLAYLRSGVALLVAGLTIINFATHTWILVLGIGCLPAGIVVSIVGSARYARINKTIKNLYNLNYKDTKTKENTAL